ncbi:unnamed protein product [Cylicocyclus nassatus]|uniref:Palmitoyltransferase n=1 Tax=Cylicocyclus nassatus TaxID=53992 RepID=A0AA36GPE8_CYLNA|nr:unnamed protein product [Cylicocyclus nassatus]
MFCQHVVACCKHVANVANMDDTSDCHMVSKIGYLIIGEILVNVILFHYYSRHNCVTHWQRQSCVAELIRSVPTSDELVAEEEGEYDPTYLSKFCNVCSREAPIRSHHCPICNICVLRKDHHCFITGACVGLGNQRYFIMFLFWVGVGLLLGARYIAIYLYETSSAGFPLGFLYCIGPIAVVRWFAGYSTFLHVSICTLFAFTLASLVTAWGYFGLEIYYTCCGYTMYEYHSSIRDAFDGDGANIGERFRLIFGRYWILNFFFPQFWNAQILTTQIATNLFRVRSKQL